MYRFAMRQRLGLILEIKSYKSSLLYIIKCLNSAAKVQTLFYSPKLSTSLATKQMLLRISGIGGDDVVTAVDVDGCWIAAELVELVYLGLVILWEQHAEKTF